MKKDSDDHDGKMLTHQMFRRQAHGTRGSRVEGLKVKRPGQRGVDHDRDYGAQKPARGSTRAREHERTRERKELMHLPAPGLRGVGRSVPPCVRTSVQGLGRTREVCPCW